MPPKEGRCITKSDLESLLSALVAGLTRVCSMHFYVGEFHWTKRQETVEIDLFLDLLLSFHPAFVFTSLSAICHLTISILAGMHGFSGHFAASFMFNHIRKERGKHAGRGGEGTCTSLFSGRPMMERQSSRRRTNRSQNVMAFTDTEWHEGSFRSRSHSPKKAPFFKQVN